MIVVDAFSSDAIPIHLLTKEAVELYFRKMTEQGILLVHISNRYLDLEPVVGNIAQRLGLAARHRYDRNNENEEYKSSSEWIVLARKLEYLDKLATDSEWKEVEVKKDVGVWTDDYSNLLRIFAWTN